MTTSEKLEQLCKIEGLSEKQLLSKAIIQNECSGICMNDNCDYITLCKPDAVRNYCKVCDTHSITSCLILAGFI